MDKKLNSSVEELVGQELDGKYRIIRALGAGAMGVVYEAHHLGIERKLALKVLHPDVTENVEVLERFKREARITGKLGHENIIEITDTGLTPTGSPYLVMEYLDGRSLDQAITDDGPFSAEKSIEILAHVLDALSAVHAAGVIHRDLKPDNIFLAEQGRPGKPRTVVKLLDFGISKPLDTSLGPSTLTKTGMVLGTPYYMAPEQVRGKELDPRADVYATGVILYEMLTGELPFDGDSFGDLFAAILQDRPTKPSKLVPEIPAKLDRIVLKAFARAKKDRYDSADDFMWALAPFGPPGLITTLCEARKVCLEVEPRLSVNELVQTGVEPAKPQPPFALIAAIVVLTLVCAGLSAYVFFGGMGTEPAPTSSDRLESVVAEELEAVVPATVAPEPVVEPPGEVDEAGTEGLSETDAGEARDGEVEQGGAPGEPDESLVKQREMPRNHGVERHGIGDGSPSKTPPPLANDLDPLAIDIEFPEGPSKRPVDPLETNPIREIDLEPPPSGESEHGEPKKPFRETLVR